MQQLVLVQIMRAVAASMVALGHFQDESVAIAAQHGARLHPFLTELMGFGVDLFFVISGFVMVYASRREFATATAAAGPRFLIRRLVRIAPFYWAVTTLMVLTVLILPGAVNHGALHWDEVVKSFLFIPYAVNGGYELSPVYRPGWTLVYEMQFYVLFALFIALPMRRAVLAMTAALCALVLGGLAIQPGPGAFDYWSGAIVLEFLAGAWIAVAFLSGRRLSSTAAWLLIALAAAMVLSTADGVPSLRGPDRAAIWGAPAAMIVAALVLSGWMQVRAPAWLKPAVLLGDASYALYLTHVIVIRVQHLAWDRLNVAHILPDGAFVWVGMAVILPIAIVTHLAFEKPVTGWLRDRLERPGTRPAIA